MTSYVIERDRDVLGGTPVFYGTRVPVCTLFDDLEGGQTIGVFLDDFPTVTELQVKDVLSALKHEVLANVP